MSEGPPYPPHPDERPSPAATRDDRDSVDDIEDLLVQKGQRMAELLRQKEEVIGHLDNERKGLKEQLANVTDALREARLSQSSVTSERSEVGRRASTWLLVYMFSRGLFRVQYEGMSATEIEAALTARRKEGHPGGMPVGAKVMAEQAWKVVLAGGDGVGYLQQLSTEPLFVALKDGNYTCNEMKAEYVGAVYAHTARRRWR